MPSKHQIFLDRFFQYIRWNKSDLGKKHLIDSIKKMWSDAFGILNVVANNIVERGLEYTNDDPYRLHSFLGNPEINWEVGLFGLSPDAKERSDERIRLYEYLLNQSRWCARFWDHHSLVSDIRDIVHNKETTQEDIPTSWNFDIAMSTNYPELCPPFGLLEELKKYNFKKTLSAIREKALAAEPSLATANIISRGE